MSGGKDAARPRPFSRRVPTSRRALNGLLLLTPIYGSFSRTSHAPRSGGEFREKSCSHDGEIGYAVTAFEIFRNLATFSKDVNRGTVWFVVRRLDPSRPRRAGDSLRVLRKRRRDGVDTPCESKENHVLDVHVRESPSKLLSFSKSPYYFFLNFRTNVRVAWGISETFS